MYNIHSHYENLFSYIKTVTGEPVLLYFYPFGAIEYENLEILHCNGQGTSPIFLCYDQEPVIDHLHTVIKQLKQDWGTNRHIVLLNTESNSDIKNQIIQHYNLKDCYYFFHIFAAADWYRGYQYCADLIPPEKRTIKKKYITFNRITGNSRVYRSFFIAELAKHNLLEHGHVSYSHTCPEHGDCSTSLTDSITRYNIPADYVSETKHQLDNIQSPLRIDFKEEKYIPNGSQTLNAIPEMMESFLHVVTETCFWETKDHLTEKIFKPIVARQPFVLLGCPDNLAYLKRYGFKTFDSWWDESYDQIQDPITRIQAVVKIIKELCSMPNEDLESMLQGMKYVLEYNYNLFYSQEFINSAWKEVQENLTAAIPRPQLLTSQEN